ncbi:hypothetical protein Q5P01_022113 [Channa striata]|uniref:Uncharacterized protein n=1 Tax=Channa striata TaxID=64152 RepID=A0AA88IX81_CHASR|nr:hypothetical protein Q5P01_022113 [Channa striata]
MLIAVRLLGSDVSSSPYNSVVTRGSAVSPAEPQLEEEDGSERSRVSEPFSGQARVAFGCVEEKNHVKLKWTRQGQQYQKFLMVSHTPTHVST